MKTISQILSVLLPAIYLLVVFIISYIFFGRLSEKLKNDQPKLEKKILIMLIILIVVHAVQILLRGLALEILPLSTKFDALSFLAFATITLTLVIEWSNENKTMVYFAVFLSFIIQTISSVFYSWNLTPNPLLSDTKYVFHVVLTIFIYNALSSYQISSTWINL